MIRTLSLFLLPGVFSPAVFSPAVFSANVAWAQPCGAVPQALQALNDVVAAFYQGSDGAAAYCPDDLSSSINLTEADRLAKAMDSGARQLAAVQIAAAAEGLSQENLQALANASALLDALLAQEMATQGPGLDSILNEIHGLAAASDNALIQRQIGLNLWRTGAQDQQSKDLIERILPSKPDYDRIFEDGRAEVAVKLRTGRDGFRASEFEEAFDVPGAELVEIEKDKHIQVTYTIQPDDPALAPVTWNLDIVRSDSREHFADVHDSSIPVSMFGDHSQLGTSLDRALGARPEGGESSTDFFWVDACKSKVFASRLSQAYPMAHFVYTKDSEYFRDMPVSFERGLVALANRYDYDQMRRLVAAGSAWQGRNYIFPDDPAKFAYQDQDGDGITDSEDRLFNVDQGGSDGLPEGEFATRAVTIANTYLAYSSAYQHFGARLDVVVEDHYRPDGIFEGEPGGPVTRIETRTDAYGESKHFVAVSDEALKMGQSERTASIVAEMGAHQGRVQGWSEKYTEAAAYLVGVAVYDVWFGGEFDGYRDAYSPLPEDEMDQFDAARYLENHEFVTSEGIGRFISDHMGASENP
jgi:hypothetical protein